MSQRARQSGGVDGNAAGREAGGSRRNSSALPQAVTRAARTPPHPQGVSHGDEHPAPAVYEPHTTAHKACARVPAARSTETESRPGLLPTLSVCVRLSPLFEQGSTHVPEGSERSRPFPTRHRLRDSVRPRAPATTARASGGQRLCLPHLL